MIKNLLLVIIQTSLVLAQNVDTTDSVNSKIPNPNNVTLKDSLYNIDLFESLLSEAKLFYAEAIISDLIGDTLDAMHQFDNFFKALAQLQVVSENDELDKLKYQQISSAGIEYYDNKSISIDHSKTGFSTAVLRDQLDQYIYSQSLDDLVNVKESVEIIEGHVPITYNKQVENVISYYKTRGRSSIQKWLNRERKYKEIILPILKDEGLPPELFYVAMIESGLRPSARSFANAVGYWQFIESTAKNFGLKKSFYIDERQDFIKSTKAACKYLKYLYGRFDDWYLAFAAYNTGEGRIDRHIKYFKTRNFWELKNLPKETQNYIPSVMAIIFISKDPEKYGFTINSEESFDWDIKVIDKSVKLTDIARCSGIDTKILKSYNPELVKDVIYIEPKSTYEFRMPKNCNPEFDVLFADVESLDPDNVVIKKHKIKSGESLWSIAVKYGSTITAICEMNNISRKKPIRVGKILKVPIGNYKAPPKKVYHTVRGGETLSGIAVRFRTSVKKIKKLNGLRSDFIKKGQKLRIK